MELANLFWKHPLGDTFKVPCHHFEVAVTDTVPVSVPTSIEVKQQHPHDELEVTVPVKIELKQQHGPHSVTPPKPEKWPPMVPGPPEVSVPCVHLAAEASFAKLTKEIPCMHLTLDVKTETKNVPIYTVRLQHPEGHDSALRGPCVHLLLPSMTDPTRRIVFFSDDANFQRIASELVDLLVSRLHVRNVGVGTRPLLFFFREALHGNPTDANDPFWSHYDPALHAIQITRNPEKMDYVAVRATLCHELGHAIVGQRCVQVATRLGPHKLKEARDPGTAMCEGWADFVELALTRSSREQPAGESACDPAVPRTTDIEYNIMMILWDLYDTARQFRGPHGSIGLIPDNDPAVFSFEELFGVFSPSLDTLPAGPVIWSIEDYLRRLKTMHPDRASAIDAVRAMHLA